MTTTEVVVKQVARSVASQVGSQIGRALIRGVLGSLDRRRRQPALDRRIAVTACRAGTRTASCPARAGTPA